MAGQVYGGVCAEGPANGDAQAQIRKFGTANAVLTEVREWLLNCGCTHVVMESTGEYRRLIFNVLEEAAEAVSARRAIAYKRCWKGRQNAAPGRGWLPGTTKAHVAAQDSARPIDNTGYSLAIGGILGTTPMNADKNEDRLLWMRHAV
jgi:hypothetical protein